jgi:imidazolonepropionase-like amidohydrolase
MKKYILCALLFFSIKAFSQIPHPINGVQDERHVCYALTQVSIHVNADEVIKNATILVQNGIITNVGSQIAIPQGAVVIPQNGKHLYPAFIDLWSGYGLPSPEGRKRRYDEKTDRDDAGPFAWNMAIHPEYEAVNNFSVNAAQAASLRKAGFASVLTHAQDGIMRGTGLLVSLADKIEHQVIINPKPASFFSFDKGSSSQDYPSSLMGSIALLRQSFYDARWYAQGGKLRYTNQSLQAITDQEKLPAFFSSSNWQDILRVNKIGTEFGRKFIVFGTDDAYQRVDEIKETGMQLILPLQLPEGWNVSDSYTTQHLPLSEIMHWEAAACNAAAMFKAGVSFAFSASGLTDLTQTTEMLHKAVKAGLPAKEAIRALTATPAKMIAAETRIGQIKMGMEASFFLTNDTLFHPGNRIVQTWVQGVPYDNESFQTPDIRGKWNVLADGLPNLELNISQTTPKAEGQISIGNKEAKSTIKLSGTRIDITVSHPELPSALRLNGSILSQNGTSTLSGKGSTEVGTEFEWSATFLQAPIDSSKADTIPVFTIDSLKLKYPFGSFGFDEVPQQENILLKNATVWTCEKEGRLEQADFLVIDGKIAAFGKNLKTEGLLPKGASIKTLDATGKHITPGIVDEHSHIAITRGVNEGTQNNTAEVRIGDVVESNDPGIYYQLAGGVTSAQLLHGSANPIGGQSAIIKLRWGKTPEQMLNAKAPGHIKFALGENVKQSNWGDSKRSRFPQTRMGVEQVYFDAFQRAKDYMRNKELWEKSSASQRLKLDPFRSDLELDAIVEIIIGTRNITCHSYVQSEVNMLLHVADSMRFHVNTFTHILEGYKVADKIKAHGANASTFSDWWAYKFEVNDAIPYNAALLTRMGVNTGINSDDTEMGRRLNQEAAKAILYGGLSQEEALKLVTINPAKMLKIDGHTGSLKVGKDADFVVWNANPLSIVAKAEMTFIEGIRYYDSLRNDSLQVQADAQKNRIISKMLKGGSTGKKLRIPKVKRRHEYECEDLYNGELMEEEEIK